MQIQSILQQAGNFFLEPGALALLLGLIPLIIFYLVKPKPEEVMLPSMRFFMDKKKNSRIRSSLRMLRRNAFLLLHILLVAGIAVAAAQPYIEDQVQSEQAVLVLDRSASMNDDFEEAKNYLKDNLGEENTVIVVDEDTRVIENSVDASKARQAIDGVEEAQTGTDIASALRRASSMEGRVFIASDMDHSTGDQEINSLLDGLRANGPVSIMKTSQDNSWGIVEATPGETTVLEVENFESEPQEIKVEYGDSRTEVKLESGEVETLELDMEEGRNTITLEADDYKPDNSFHVYVPGEKSFDAVIIGEDPYMEKALSLIDFTTVRTVEAGSDKLPEADIHVVTDSPDILPSVREDAISSDSLTVVKQSEDNLGALDLEGEMIERDVTLETPINTFIGTTGVYNISTEGYESMSQPGNAMMRSDNSSVLVYNIEQGSFNRDFLYPVFWKRALSEMLDVPQISSRNLRTGDTVQGERAVKTGFREYEGEVYALNHVNRDESVTEKEFVRSSESDEMTGERTVSHFAALLLVFLALMEYAYLDRQGDLE